MTLVIDSNYCFKVNFIP